MDKRDLKRSAKKISEMSADLIDKARPRRRSRGLLWLVLGFAGGLATLYLFDADRGAQRRRMLMDQVRSGTNEVTNRLASTGS